MRQVNSVILDKADFDKLKFGGCYEIAIPGGGMIELVYEGARQRKATATVESVDSGTLRSRIEEYLLSHEKVTVREIADAFGARENVKPNIRLALIALAAAKKVKIEKSLNPKTRKDSVTYVVIPGETQEPPIPHQRQKKRGGGHK